MKTTDEIKADLEAIAKFSPILAEYFSAGPGIIAHLLQQLAASEARTRTKEAQLNKIAGLLGAIDTPAEHETALRAILRVVMDEN